VDNVILARYDETMNLTLKEKLMTKFEMKDLGKLEDCPEIEVVYSKKGDFHLPKKICI